MDKNCSKCKLPLMSKIEMVITFLRKVISMFVATHVAMIRICIRFSAIIGKESVVLKSSADALFVDVTIQVKNKDQVLNLPDHNVCENMLQLLKSGNRSDITYKV